MENKVHYQLTDAEKAILDDDKYQVYSKEYPDVTFLVFSGDDDPTYKTHYYASAGDPKVPNWVEHGKLDMQDYMQSHGLDFSKIKWDIKKL